MDTINISTQIDSEYATIHYHLYKKFCTVFLKKILPHYINTSDQSAFFAKYFKKNIIHFLQSKTQIETANLEQNPNSLQKQYITLPRAWLIPILPLYEELITFPKFDANDQSTETINALKALLEKNKPNFQKLSNWTKHSRDIKKYVDHKPITDLNWDANTDLEAGYDNVNIYHIYLKIDSNKPRDIRALNKIIRNVSKAYDLFYIRTIMLEVEKKDLIYHAYFFHQYKTLWQSGLDFRQIINKAVNDQLRENRSLFKYEISMHLIIVDCNYLMRNTSAIVNEYLYWHFNFIQVKIPGINKISHSHGKIFKYVL